MMEYFFVARIVGRIVVILIICLVVYFMVRPNRRDRDTRRALPPEPEEADAMWRTVDRMEARLEVLERALADQVERPRIAAAEHEEIFAPVDDDRDSGRK